MANLILGSAKCAICSCLLQNDGNVVSLPLFRATSPGVARLSDAGVHFTCLKRYTYVEDIRGLFLGLLGSPGERPNGALVVDVSSITRMCLERERKSVIIIYSPLFLAMRLKCSELPEVLNWFDATDGAGGTLERPGIGVELCQQDPAQKVMNIRMCGFRYTPSKAPANTVNLQTRQLSDIQLATFVDELHKVYDSKD